MKVEVISTPAGIVVRLDSKTYDHKELGDRLEVRASTVATYFSKQKDNPEKLKLWIEDYIWRRENKEPNGVKVYRNPSGCLCSVGVVQMLTGVINSVASNLLKNWERGDIDTDDLFVPNNMRRTAYVSSTKTNRPRGKRANWGNLTNKSRDHNLKKIPNPTKYEQALGHMHVGDYIWPATGNPGGHHRY